MKPQSKKPLLILLAIAIGALIVYRNPTPAEHSPTQSTPTESEADKKLEAACAGDWRKCQDAIQLTFYWNGRAGAKHRCRDAANSMAKYGEPKWPYPYFDNIFPDENISGGTYTLIENDAQFQNGFGAYAHTQLICKYDLKTSTVEDVQFVH
jgi:hypothetical protein